MVVRRNINFIAADNLDTVIRHALVSLENVAGKKENKPERVFISTPVSDDMQRLFPNENEVKSAFQMNLIPLCLRFLAARVSFKTDTT